MNSVILSALVLGACLVTGIDVSAESGTPCDIPRSSSFNPFTHLLSFLFGGGVASLVAAIVKSE